MKSSKIIPSITLKAILFTSMAFNVTSCSNNNNFNSSSINNNTSTSITESDSNMNNKISLKIGNTTLIGVLEDNVSTRALVDKLKESSVTLHMNDYAGMEKVAPLGFSLPTCDSYINTSACDLILYLGHRFVIYYDTNSWSLTRLGKIINTSPTELRRILGTGDVTVTLSIYE